MALPFNDNVRRRDFWRLIIFLLLVLAMRAAHLGLLGPVIVPGNNERLVLNAKSILAYGVREARLDVPPGPELTLAAVSHVFYLEPAEAIFLLALAAQLLFALAYWLWLHALPLPAKPRSAALLIFIFLPVTNSYEAFDNAPVVISVAAFFLMIHAFHQLCAKGDRLLCWTLMIISSWSLLLVRAEFAIYTPCYLVLFFGLRFLLEYRQPRRREMVAAAVMLGSLLLGALTTMSLRAAWVGDFSLTEGSYSCATFLDGTPDAWLTVDEQDSYDARILRGIEIFGRPADYDYSLAAMMRNHPGETLGKFALSIPRWLFHLGRRHVVAPLPIACLAAIAIVALPWKRRSRLRACLPMLLGVVLMTLPLAVLVVYAEYMMPAFAGISVLAALGYREIFALCRRFFMQPLSTKGQTMLWWTGVICLCAMMELLMLRGGGILSDVPSLQPLSAAIDDQFAAEPNAAMLLDPYLGEIDSFARSDFRNRWIRSSEIQRRFEGSIPKEFWPFRQPPLELVDSASAKSINLRYAVIWTSGSQGKAAHQNRIELWRRKGFKEFASRSVADSVGGRYKIAFLRRSAF